MKLVVSELLTSLKQSIEVGSKNEQIYALRPWLLKVGSPMGSLKMEIIDSRDRIVASSDSVTIASISSAAAAHGHVRFLVAASLKAGTSYWARLQPTGYSFSESAWIGWVRGFDQRALPLGYNPVDDFDYPLDLEIWTVRKAIRRTA